MRLTGPELADFVRTLVALVRNESNLDKAQTRALGQRLTALDPVDRDNIVTLTVWEVERRAANDERRKFHGAQRRAWGLLVSFLDPEQRRSLRQSRVFYVKGSAGGMYRLRPRCGRVERVERHGRKWFAKVSYCLHDPDRVMPPADVSLAHMLMLLADEPGFLAAANATVRQSLLWNGEYLRELNQFKRERAAREEAA